MKKKYTAPEVIVHGTVEAITQMGKLPWHPQHNNPRRPPPHNNHPDPSS